MTRLLLGFLIGAIREGFSTRTDEPIIRLGPRSNLNQSNWPWRA
jgi:hypothetical protein